MCFFFIGKKSKLIIFPLHPKESVSSAAKQSIVLPVQPSRCLKLPGAREGEIGHQEENCEKSFIIIFKLSPTFKKFCCEH